MSPPVAARQVRILQIMRRLLAGHGVNASELARQAGVCRRTIFRDLQALKAAGVEVHYDDVADCYRLGRREMVTIPQLDHCELTALVAAVRLSVLRQLPDCHELLQQTLHKLLQSLPSPLRHQAARVVESCHTQLDGRTQQTVRQRPLISTLLTAISLRKVIRARIADQAKGEVETRFAPYQLLATVDCWEAIGRSSYHRSVRAFAPDQLRRLDLTEEIYAIPRQYQRRQWHIAS